jgi:hypothetical protein
MAGRGDPAARAAALGDPRHPVMRRARHAVHDNDSYRVSCSLGAPERLSGLRIPGPEPGRPPPVTDPPPKRGRKAAPPSCPRRWHQSEPGRPTAPAERCPAKATRTPSPARGVSPESPVGQRRAIDAGRLRSDPVASPRRWPTTAAASAAQFPSRRRRPSLTDTASLARSSAGESAYWDGRDPRSGLCRAAYGSQPDAGRAGSPPVCLGRRS